MSEYLMGPFLVRWEDAIDNQRVVTVLAVAHSENDAVGLARESVRQHCGKTPEEMLAFTSGAETRSVPPLRTVQALTPADGARVLFCHAANIMGVNSAFVAT